MNMPNFSILSQKIKSNGKLPLELWIQSEMRIPESRDLLSFVGIKSQYIREVILGSYLPLDCHGDKLELCTRTFQVLISMDQSFTSAHAPFLLLFQEISADFSSKDWDSLWLLELAKKKFQLIKDEQQFSLYCQIMFSQFQTIAPSHFFGKSTTPENLDKLQLFVSTYLSESRYWNPSMTIYFYQGLMQSCSKGTLQVHNKR
jgi:hypothetical protein